MKIKYRLSLTILTLAIGLAGAPPANGQTNKWRFGASLYGLASGMSGDLMVKGIPVDVDVGFDKIWDNLDFGAMGTVSVGHGRWTLRTDVIYMSLGAAKSRVSADFDQWLVEPTLGCRLSRGVELLAGARYNNLNGEIRGPLGRNPTGLQDWWDPIIGAHVRVPIIRRLSCNVRGDIGGFGVGSNLTWQAFPYLDWQFAKAASLQAGYRFVYSDYATGNGLNQFRYDVLTQGPQVGITLRF